MGSSNREGCACCGRLASHSCRVHDAPSMHAPLTPRNHDCINSTLITNFVRPVHIQLLLHLSLRRKCPIVSWEGR
jgi:hypothetical protein